MKKIFMLLAMVLLYQELHSACTTFSPIPTSPFATGFSPFSLAFSPLVGGTTLFAAVANEGASVSVYIVNPATGQFSAVLGSPFAAGILPQSVAFTPLTSANTLFAAVTNFESKNLSIYSVNTTTGVFGLIDSLPIGFNPTSVAFSPLIGTKIFAAVANYNISTLEGYVSIYTVSSSGVFTLLGSPIPTGGDGTTSVAFSPLTESGDLFVAVTNNNLSSSSISVFSVNTSTNLITTVPGSPFPNSVKPFSVAFSPLTPTGNLFAAVANTDSNTISVYSVDTSSGVFTLTSSRGVRGGPTGIAFSPFIGTDLFAAVSNLNNNTVSFFSVDPGNGVFSELAHSPLFSGMSPSLLAISPLIGTDTFFVGVANNGSNTASVFTFALEVSIAPSLQVVCTNDIIQLKAIAADGLAPYTYSWTEPNGSTTTTETITIPNPTAANAGTYTLTVTDPTGCTGTSSATVVIKAANGPCS